MNIKSKDNKTTEEIRVFVKSSDKAAIRQLADDWGVSMATVMKIAFANLRRQLDHQVPILEPTQQFIDAIKESYDPKNIFEFKGETAADLLKELESHD